MSKKIIVSGNKHYGLAKQICEQFPSALFCSRSNGDFNFSQYESMESFANLSLEYDVYISCSYIPYFRQLLLLAKVHNTWIENKKKGQMIILGSTADWSTKVWLYPTEKKALRDFCRRYAAWSSGGGPELHKGNGIRITYLAPGMLDLPKQKEKHGEQLAKINPQYIVNVIDWLINQPEHINIHEISMDPVQT